MDRRCTRNILISQLMIATNFQRLYVFGVRQHDWTTLNMHTNDQTNHVLHCGPFIVFTVLAYISTRLPPLNRPRRFGVVASVVHYRCYRMFLVLTQHQALVQSCCLTPKTWVNPAEFRCNHVHKLRNTLFRMHSRFTAAIFDSPLTMTSDIIR